MGWKEDMPYENIYGLTPENITGAKHPGFIGPLDTPPSDFMENWSPKGMTTEELDELVFSLALGPAGGTLKIKELVKFIKDIPHHVKLAKKLSKRGFKEFYEAPKSLLKSLQKPATVSRPSAKLPKKWVPPPSSGRTAWGQIRSRGPEYYSGGLPGPGAVRDLPQDIFRGAGGIPPIQQSILNNLIKKGPGASIGKQIPASEMGERGLETLIKYYLKQFRSPSTTMDIFK